MFCQQCGFPLAENAVFCSNCGTQVGTASSDNNGTVPANPAPQPLPLYSYPNPAFQPPAPKSYYGLPLLINGILAIICGCMASMVEAFTDILGFYNDTLYRKLVHTWHSTAAVCKLWAFAGVALAIVGIVLLKVKPRKKARPQGAFCGFSRQL